MAEANHPYSDDDDSLNEAEVNGNWTPQEKALHEARLKAKAKRRLRKSSSRNSTSESFSESGEVAGGDPHSPKGKVNTNDRKSRTGKGRGLPKKGIICSPLQFSALFSISFLLGSAQRDSRGCYSNTTERPVTSFVCNTNATTKADIEAIAYLLLTLWHFVRLEDHSVVSVQPIPLDALFQK